VPLDGMPQPGLLAEMTDPQEEVAAVNSLLGEVRARARSSA